MRHAARVLLFALIATHAIAAHRLVPISDSSLAAARGSDPQGFLRVGSLVFFVTNNVAHGAALWRTDGTPVGTFMASDLSPLDSSPVVAGSLGDAVIVTEQHTDGIGVWRSDGSPSGTKKIGSIPPRYSGDKPPAVSVVTADTRLFALVTPDSYGYSPMQLWSGDGTTADFKRIVEIGSQTGPTLGVNGKLYFVAKDASVGWQLWVSDGTPAGTRILLRDLQCFTADSCGSLLPVALFRLGSTAYVVTKDLIYRTDGTWQGTMAIAPPSSKPYAGVIAGRSVAYLFSGRNVAKTDGRTLGPWIPLRDAWTDARLLDDDRLVFVSLSSAAEYTFDVWVTDGSAEGTAKIDSVPRNPSGYNSPALLGVAGTRLFLGGWTKATGSELWTLDVVGDVAGGGAALLEDIDPREGLGSPLSSFPAPGVSLGSKFIFAASSWSGREPWITDGTAAGTTLLANIASEGPVGAISGTVRDAESGAPVQNALVILCGAQCDDAVVTGKDGAYRIDAVLPGRYTLTARSPISVAQVAQSATITEGFETAGVDFSLTRGGTISGTVRRASGGAPLPTTQVLVRNTLGQIIDRVVEINPDGSYRSHELPTGQYYVESHVMPTYNVQPAVDQLFNGHNCPPAGCDYAIGEPVRVNAGSDTPGIDLFLHDYGTISGTVRDAASGAPIRHALVMFTPAGAQFYTSGAYTDADGHYTSRPLADGTYYITASSEDHYSTANYPNIPCPYPCDVATGKAVALPIDGAVTGIDVGLRSTRTRISGVVLDRNGVPVPTIDVNLAEPNGSIHYPSVRTDARGRFEIREGYYYGSPLPPWTYYLRVGDELYGGMVCAPKCAGNAIPIVLKDKTDSVAVDWTLQAVYSTVSGTVVDAATGQPFSASGTVYLRSATESSPRSSISFYGPSFTVSLLSREAALHLITNVTGYHPAAYPGVETTCSYVCAIPPGATPIAAGKTFGLEMRLKRYGRISGTVYDAATGLPVPYAILYFITGGKSAQYTPADKDGRYVFPSAQGPTHAYVSQPQDSPYFPQIYPDIDCHAACDAVAMGQVINAPDGVDVSGIDFHLRRKPTSISSYIIIGGRVVDDVTGTGIPNVTVSVPGAELQTRTNEQGFYSMNGPVRLIFDGFKVLATPDPPYVPEYYPSLISTRILDVAHNISFRLRKLQVTSISPPFGSVAGGTQIVIAGTGFAPWMGVRIGDKYATIVDITPTAIVARTPPAAAGAAHVLITVSYSRSLTLAHAFTYIAVPATAIQVLSGNGQNAVCQTEFAPLRARVVDAQQRPVAGVTVTFTAPATGPSGTFAGPTSVVTGEDGIAAAPPFTANSIPGSYTVTATAGDLSVTFALTNAAAPSIPPRRRAGGH